MSGFGVATSASDDADIVELMLTDGRYRLSFSERLDPEASHSREWDFELGGAWDVATFVVEEIADTIDLAVDGLGSAYVWLADSFDVWIGPDSEGVPYPSGSAEIDAGGTYFLEVGQASKDASSYTLRSSASLLPYYDEDGNVLLAEDEMSHALAGAFDYFNDIDVYELHLRRGETVAIWTDSILTDTALTLYDSASNIVAQDDDSGPTGHLGFLWNAEVSFEALSTGTYYLQVFVPDGAPGGSYIINAEILG